MRALRAWMTRIAGTLLARRRDHEFHRELQTHLELHVEEQIRAGVSRDAARRHGLTMLGGLDQVRERQRERRGLPLVDSLKQDIRYALRMMARAPGFTAAALFTLGLGIGATTAIFSIVDTTLIRPLSYRAAEQLVAIHESVPGLPPGVWSPVNVAHFREWKNGANAFEDLVLVGPIGVHLTGSGEPEMLTAARVSSGMFEMLEVRPRLGRAFRVEEDQPGRDRVVVISDALWRRRFNSDASVIGRTLTLDGEQYEVIGVLPPTFRFPRIAHLYSMTMPADLATPEIWKPFAAVPDEIRPFGAFNFACIGRLKAGVSIDRALAQLNGIQTAFGAKVAGLADLRAIVVPLQDQLVDRSRRGLQLTLAAVCLVFLIGCVNISNLLLSRSIGRQREVAIRSSIGASRARLMRQMLVESLTMSAIGGAGAAGLAYALIPLLLQYAPPDLPRLDEVQVDVRLLGFAVVLTGVAGLVIGILPAWRFGGPASSNSSTLRTRTNVQASGSMRSSLVGLEVAMTAASLIVGGLLLNSLIRLLNVDPGFSPSHVITAELDIPTRRYPDLQTGLQAMSRFVTAVAEIGRSLPGVVAAGASNNTPLTGTGSNSAVMVEGAPVPRPQRPRADTRIITTDYLTTIGTPLRTGRFFTEADRGRNVAVIAAATARRLWPSQDAVGRRFAIGADDAPRWFEVTGVVGDVRTMGLDQPPPLSIYLPEWTGFFSRRVSLSVRTAGNPSMTSAALVRALREFDRELVIPPVRTMEDVIDASVAQRRFQLNLILLFGGLATLLAALGIHGVVSQSVLQRTNEFGVRLALGARSSQIRGLVFRQGALPIAVGLTVGVLTSIALGRFIGSLLFDVKPTDIVTLGSVIGLLTLVSLAAMHLPARRATRIDPMIALRAE